MNLILLLIPLPQQFFESFFTLLSLDFIEVCSRELFFVLLLEFEAFKNLVLQLFLFNFSLMDFL